MHSEIAGKADFSQIRYAQCWEDADVLLSGLDIRSGHTCLSIASAGDNTLAMLSRGPERVIALDLSPAQLACLELRVAAYRALSHPQMLALMGSVPGPRETLYHRCRGLLSVDARAFWDARPGEIERGIGGAGKFERYLALFRERILPLIHPRARVMRFLTGGAAPERERFYRQEWDTWRWRLLFRLFFSRPVMGRMGRDPRFFRYAEGSVAETLLRRARRAGTMLDPARNPYLQWILTGRHVTALPCSLRPENFEAIRDNLDRLEWRCGSLEEQLDTLPAGSIDRFNLSNIFEYMAPKTCYELLERLARAGRCGGRLAYWNLLAERRRPAHLAGRLRPLTGLAEDLHRQDKAFFYSAFVLEEIIE